MNSTNGQDLQTYQCGPINTTEEAIVCVASMEAYGLLGWPTNPHACKI